MCKESVRNFYKNVFSRLSAEEVRRAASVLLRILLRQPFFKDVSSVMCYVSLYDELPTLELIDYLLVRGYRVSVPFVTGDCEMLAVYVSSANQLRRGSFGIMEPEYLPENKAEKSGIDLAVIPGVCFDRSRNRLGRGAGYYDRFLQDFEGIKVGICHHKCLADSLSTESHDIPMDFVVTDAGVV